MKKMNLGLISDNRSTIYGLAALWIMLFHSSLLLSKPWMAPIYNIKKMGECGVEIFLLVSGISLHFSYTKRRGLWDFYSRRMQRILIPTLIMTIPRYIVCVPDKKPSIAYFLTHITGLGLFVYGKRTIWFITAILLCYAIYPMLYHFFANRRHSPWALLFLLSACILVNTFLWKYFPSFWDNSNILFRRIPIFIIGAYCGKFVQDRRSIPLSQLQVVAIALFLSLAYPLTKPYWQDVIPYKYAFIPLSIAFTMLFAVMGNIPWIKSMASWFAPITLEIYLFHEIWIKVVTFVMPNATKLPINLIAFMLTLLSSYLLLLFERRIMRGIKR